MTNWLCSFIVTLIFEPLQRTVHDSGVCWFFAVYSLASLIFVVSYVYETKGKTLQEINDHFGVPKSENSI
ncbi:hypothetical protein Avbf_00610 [Armadillidium vulgare]|nr:hypothetical protein Avbf_00610 [Armadillidium vulgare]